MAFSSLIILSFLFFCPSFSSSLLAVNSSSSSPSKGGFTARLIHRSSPKSPLYNPNVDQLDLMKSAKRKSLARSHYFASVLSKNFSMKYSFTPYYLSDGDYVMNFKIGSPPLDTYAIPDTGSDLIWLQCQPCISCFDQGAIPLYDPSKSSSYQQVLYGSQDCNYMVGVGDENECQGTQSPCLCTYTIQYEDGGYSHGDIVRDTITILSDDDWLDGNSLSDLSADMNFGCGHNNSDGYSSAAPPGIIGLMNDSYSMLRQLGYFDFSYCFSSDAADHDSRITFGNQVDVLQGYTTALVPNAEGFYIFKNVDGIYVDSEKVEGIPEWVFQFSEDGLGGLIIDTGAIYTGLYRLALDLLVESLKEHISLEPIQDTRDDPWPLCYKREDVEKTKLPDIEFQFTDNESGSLWFSDENMWINDLLNDEDEVQCLAVLPTDDYSFLGIRQQRDMRFGYDLRNQIVSMDYTYCH